MITTFVVSDITSRKKAYNKLVQAFGKAPKKVVCKMSSIEAFHLQQVATHDSSLWIDDTTWDDLEMDLIFKRINACCSSVGEEYLYHLLHKQGNNVSVLDAREQLITFLDNNSDVRHLRKPF